MNRAWVDVESSAGVIQGDGPLLHVVSWSSSAQLSKAGKFSLSISAADPRADLLQTKRIVRCYTLLNGAVTEIGSGIVDKITYASSDNGMVITATGDDLLRELTYRSVHDLKLYDETTHIPTKVLLYNAGYTDLVDCYDGLFTNADSIVLADSNSFLFVGYSTQFNVIYSHQGTAGDPPGTDYYNSVRSDLNYGYSTDGLADPLATWPEFDIVTDEAVVNGVPWPAQLAGGTAATLFQRNPTWGTCAVNGTNAYWVRFDPEETLDTVRMEEFVIGVRSPKAADVGAIMAYAPTAWANWDDDADSTTIFDSTTSGSWAVFAGETVLNALVKLADKAGEAFRLGPDRTLHWLRTLDVSTGLLAVQATGSARQNDNANVVVIASLEEIEDSYDLVTRVYPYGAGNGKARVSLVNATLAMPTGYTLDTATNCIVATSVETALGVQIERVVAFKDIRSTDDTTFDAIEVCNELAGVAQRWLERHASVQHSYRLTLASLHALLPVGETIRVVYREVRDGTLVYDIDETLVIAAATYTWQNGQVFTSSIDVSTSGALLEDDTDIVAQAIENGVIYEAHDQPIDSTMVRGLSTSVRSVSLGAVTDHGAMSGLADDDHTGYLLATGARTGASAQAQAFTNGIVAGSVKPASDSATAVQIQNAAGTAVVNVDTTNKRVGIGVAGPDTTLQLVDQAAFSLSSTQSGQDNIHLNSPSQTAGINAYGGSIGFGTVGSVAGSSARRAAVAAVQLVNDADVVGIAFLVHPSATSSADLVEAARFYGANLIIGGTTAAAKLHVVGTADDQQLIVQANGTQTNNVVEVQDSSANVLLAVNGGGGLVINEGGSTTGDLRAEADTEENMLFLDASADTLYLGGSTNGVQIAKGGHLTLLGTGRVWEDIRIEPTVRTTGTNVPTFSQWFTNGSGSRGVYLYTFDNAADSSEKEIHFTCQLPHAWAQTAIHIHVHWIAATTAASSAVRWGLEYTWAEPGVAYGNTTLIYAITPEGGDTGTTQYKHMITEFAALTPTSSQDGFSSTLICRLWRDSSDAADTYTGDVGLLYVDAHVELDKLGSNDEYA